MVSAVCSRARTATYGRIEWRRKERRHQGHLRSWVTERVEQCGQTRWSAWAGGVAMAPRVALGMEGR